MLNKYRVIVVARVFRPEAIFALSTREDCHVALRAPRKVYEKVCQEQGSPFRGLVVLKKGLRGAKARSGFGFFRTSHYLSSVTVFSL